MADKKKLSNQIGDQIKDSLVKSLKSGDFSGLNEAINDSVNTVINEAIGSTQSTIKSKTAQYQERIKREHEERERNEAARREAIEKANEERRIREELYRDQQQRKRSRSKNSGKLLPAEYFNPVGNASSIACIVGGSAGMGIAGISVLTNLVHALFGAASFTGLIFPGVIFAISAGVLTSGISRKNILSRAKRYAEICGNKMYAKISDIAASTGTKQSRVVKDIKKMLQKGYFTQGYIDDKQTTLMLSDSLYEQYRQSEKQQELNELKTKEDLEGKNVNMEAAASLSPKEQAELNSMIAEGMESIRRLHDYNERIPGEVISKKLDILERLLNEIFNRVRSHPGQMDRIHKLMDYYLPTVLKLVEAYAEYDKVSAPGPEIREAKLEIEKTLDTINRAFVKLLNNLFEDSVWDVTTDAKVLKTMLAQEGLAEDIPIMGEKLEI
ncbi:MAG: 5-bromo-4-chloroindolyl phosphate hydrolysis family protein [Lachnospiraceae bacterium]|nr:5-bromo-4-chloroindolyl phosphate hydrolysis family protein [Lachnospiraceae bacterium]